MKSNMHRLLNRQLKRHFGKAYDFESLDPTVQSLLQDIEKSYLAYEKEKDLVENILKVNSDELYEKNKELKEVNENLEKRVQKEVEKNRLQDQKIFQQSRLVQMGEMINMIAHQWRQPLNALGLTLQNIRLNYLTDELSEAYMNEAMDKGNRLINSMSKTIDDFRNFFKENKEKELANLDEIVLSTIEIVNSSLAHKNITLLTNLSCKENIETYPHEIKQVIMNLIKNAEDALFEKGLPNPTIFIKSHVQGNKQIVMVKDNAGGVPSSIIDKIFEPYFSTKLEKDGTGLGLYMSKTIIEEHCGGRLQVANDEYGAVFTIELQTSPGLASTNVS